jgi:hypothetical protein
MGYPPGRAGCTEAMLRARSERRVGDLVNAPANDAQRRGRRPRRVDEGEIAARRVPSDANRLMPSDANRLVDEDDEPTGRAAEEDEEDEDEDDLPGRGPISLAEWPKRPPRSSAVATSAGRASPVRRSGRNGHRGRQRRPLRRAG